jgi:hypothetical protein
MERVPPVRPAGSRRVSTKGREIVELRPPPSAYGKLIEDFLALAEAKKMILPDFDWQKWSSTAEAQKLCSGGQELTHTSCAELSRLITLIVRSGRFVEGTLEEAAQSGLLAAITSRLKALEHKP